jgi:hypothetical protein
MRNPVKMSEEEIVTEIRALSGELNRTALRISELSKNLHDRAVRLRRDPDEPTRDMGAVYVAYANAWGRLGGLVGQGVRRTASLDRAVQGGRERFAAVSKQRENERIAAERVAARKASIDAIFAKNQGSVNDLVELYGEDVADHAPVR